ncbi:MAG: regulatory protein RecX [Patescibacteria group bacterium]
MQKEPYRLLLDYSFWLLGRKAYAEVAILKKLKLRAKRAGLEDSEAAILMVMARLKELKYVDDDKILENYFDYSLSAKPQGKFMFVQKMRQKGILAKYAKEAWEKRGVNEFELARKFLESRAAKLKKWPEDKRKQKTAALLASRGFSASTVWGVLDKF